MTPHATEDNAPIRTNCLEMRVFSQGDATWVAQEIANPNVLRWLTTPPSPYTHSDAVAFLRDKAKDPQHRVICRKEEPLGSVSLGAHADGTFELGYWLKESAWGQGVMREAAQAMVDWHWARSSAPLISGWIAGNVGSAQILSQLGFAPVGQIMRHTNFHGRDMPLERVRLDTPHRPLFTCKTERLVLNASTQEDLDVIHAEMGQEGVARNMATVKPNWTKEEARDWLVPRLVPGLRGFGRAVRNHEGRFLGLIGMGGGAARNMAYMFGPEHWGKGYATEALRAFLPAAFAHYPEIDVVNAEVYDDNPGSIRVLEKLGFQRQGVAGCEGIGRVEAAASSAYRVTRATLKAPAV